MTRRPAGGWAAGLLAAAACLVVTFCAPALAATYTQTIEDAADVDLGPESTDLLSVRLDHDDASARTTVTITMRDTKPEKGVEPRQSAFVWFENGADGVADVVARFERTSLGEAIASVEKVASGAPYCQPAKGSSALAAETIPIKSGEGTLEISFAFDGLRLRDPVMWAAFGATQGANPGFDYLPDYVNPDQAVKNPADRSCTAAPDVSGWQVFLPAGKIFPEGALPHSFLEIMASPHGDVHGAIPPTVPVVYPNPADRPPVASVRVSPSRPRADTVVTLDASRSTDPEGKPLQGVRWDLDGDEGFYDAYGTRVRMPFGAPGRYPVTVEVIDASGRRTQSKVTVRVRGRSPRPAAPARGRPLSRRRRASFERGLEGWSSVGMRFRRDRDGEFPLDRALDLEARVGGSYGDIDVDADSAGRGWITSFDRSVRASGLPADSRGDLATGALISPRMRAAGRYLTFRVGGNHVAERGKLSPVRVEVYGRVPGGRFKRQDRLTRSAGGLERLQQVALSLRRYQRITEWLVVVVDESPFAHVNFDSLAFSNFRGTPPPRLPVLGFANTHEHVMAHQAFGGLGDGQRPYMGVPGRSLAEAQDPLLYAYDTMRDDDAHFGGPMARVIVNTIERRRHSPGITSGLGSSEGIEFHTETLGPAHQQYHVTDLRRAWEGGLRLLSSLAVNNIALEYGMGFPREPRRGGHPCVGPSATPCGPPDQNTVHTTSDRAIVEAHAAGMRQLVAANDSWMQIVYNPDQAYDAIVNRKLAIVLGTEVDSLGSLVEGDATAEVDWLWRLGYRQIQLIHAVDNRLGGAVVFQDGYNTTQDLIKRPIKNANRGNVADSLNREGFAFERFEAPYGHFMNVEPYGCRRGSAGTPTGRPRGECVDWAFKWREQILASIDSFGLPPVVRVHPAPTRIAVDAYRPARTDQQGLRNQLGLTPYGREYVRALMHRGMVIDIEHASDRVLDALMNPGTSLATRGPLWERREGLRGCSVRDRYDKSCWRWAYPVLSSHTSFRGQSLTNPTQRCFGEEGGAAEGDPGLGEAREMFCRTIVKGFVAREFERTPSQIEFIRRAGGMIAPVVGQDPIDDVFGERAPAGSAPDWRLIPGTDRMPRSIPANTCAGSSRGWAQAHLYAVAKMRGRGVGLSGDMQMAGSAGPRYGPNACSISNAARDPHIEESLNPNQYNRGAQRPEERVTYGGAETVHVGGAGMRPFKPPGQDLRDFNVLGVRSLGMFPDLIQDGRNVGIHEDDLAPLFDSAQAYIGMWEKAYRVTGCDIGRRTTTAIYDRCGSTEVEDFGPRTGAVCRNTCPDSMSRGLRSRPSPYVQPPYRFKDPFDDREGVRGWGEWPF